MGRHIGRRNTKTLNKIRKQLERDWEDGEITQRQYDQMMNALDQEEFD